MIEVTEAVVVEYAYSPAHVSFEGRSGDLAPVKVVLNMNTDAVRQALDLDLDPASSGGQGIYKITIEKVGG